MQWSQQSLSKEQQNLQVNEEKVEEEESEKEG